LNYIEPIEQLLHRTHKIYGVGTQAGNNGIETFLLSDFTRLPKTRLASRIKPPAIKDPVMEKEITEKSKVKI